MQALNAFIIGYHTTTGELWGGYPIQSMSTHDYMDAIYYEITIIGIPIEHWTADTVTHLFDIKGARALQVSNVLSGELSDLPTEKMAGIGRAIDRLNSFYFYELAFEARAKMVVGDYRGALLMAVAALEGIHGALVSHILGSRLPADRTGEDKKLEENFIKELGFSLCNRITPYIFMDPADRPARELIQKASTAVTYRNEIMHALRNSAGEYRIRKRTNSEISDAYSAALKLFDCYRKAFEKLIAYNESKQALAPETI